MTETIDMTDDVAGLPDSRTAGAIGPRSSSEDIIQKYILKILACE